MSLPTRFLFFSPVPVYGRSLSTDAASKFVHVRIEVDAWRVRRGDFIAITGSAPILGNWNLSHAIRLESSLQMYPSWAVEFFADIDDFPIRYEGAGEIFPPFFVSFSSFLPYF